MGHLTSGGEFVSERDTNSKLIRRMRRDHIWLWNHSGVEEPLERNDELYGPRVTLSAALYAAQSYQYWFNRVCENRLDNRIKLKNTVQTMATRATETKKQYAALVVWNRSENKVLPLPG